MNDVDYDELYCYVSTCDYCCDLVREGFITSVERIMIENSDNFEISRLFEIAESIDHGIDGWAYSEWKQEYIPEDVDN